MNDVYAKFSTALLFVCVPALLVARFSWPKRVPWWAVVLGSAALSWTFINLTVYFSQAHTADLVEQAGGFEHATPALVDDWANDSGPKTFAFLFGWIGGLVILVPGLALYGIAHLLRIRGAARGALLPNKSLRSSPSSPK
jgi:hypothetical protein